jgi:hypothetical protein
MDWQPAQYMIRVGGCLGDMALSAFPAMTPQQNGADTVLTGWLEGFTRTTTFAIMQSIRLGRGPSGPVHP